MRPVPTLLVLLSLLASAYDVVRATDPGLLQDFCVAVSGTDSAGDAVFVNGKFCKDPKLVTADDFIFRGLSRAGNTSNPQNSKVTTAFVDQFPGINTLGIAMARLDFGLNGINPPHIHHRGTEMLVVVEGTLYVGFVASNQLNNRFFSKVLNKGDVFVFPQGMIHFQLNVGQTDAHAFAFLSSQNPGLITIANNVFGAKPPISADVLTKAFQADKNLINYLQGQAWFDNH